MHSDAAQLGSTLRIDLKKRGVIRSSTAGKPRIRKRTTMSRYQRQSPSNPPEQSLPETSLPIWALTALLIPAGVANTAASICFARPSHAWLGLPAGLDFETRLFARPNAPALLRRELSLPSYTCQPRRHEHEDGPYQPIERERRIARAILSVLSDCNHPLIIVTKSSLNRTGYRYPGTNGCQGPLRCRYLRNPSGPKPCTHNGAEGLRTGPASGDNPLPVGGRNSCKDHGRANSARHYRP